MKAIIMGAVACPACRRMLFLRRKSKDDERRVAVCLTPGCVNLHIEVEEPTIELQEVPRDGA